MTTGGHVSLIGQRLGRYKIEASLGRGGMAEVYRARDEKLGRDVAVKVVLPMFLDEHQFRERFLREARIAASLDHPNILPIYDFGDHDSLPYLVMPLLEAGTLADRLGGRPLAPGQAVQWAEDLAVALDTAHSAGVLHRDIKPGNVLVGGQERLLLADFGIARAFDATRLTRTGTVVGTPVYMAPEVAAGKSATAASDLYSLAIIVYEMLAGQPPFDGENVLSVLHQHATRPVPPISEHGLALPRGLDTVMERGLAKDPVQRPANCQELVTLLQEHVPPSSRRAATPPISDRLPTLEMSSRPGVPQATEGTLAPTAAKPALTHEAYATVHAPGGQGSHLKQWAIAGAVGALIAMAVFVAVQSLSQREVTSPGEPTAALPTAQASGELPSAAPAEPKDLESPPTVAGPAMDDAPAVDEPSQVAGDPPAQSPSASPTDGDSSVASSDEPATSAPPPPQDPPPRDPQPQASSRSLGDRAPRFAKRLHGLRSFTVRLQKSDFEKARETARQLPRRGPKAGQTRAMERYAEGGLALVAGDETSARSALFDALQNSRFVSSWGPSPLLLLADSVKSPADFEAWELALGYGDPRGEAAEILDRRLVDEPDDGSLRFARALVHRLEGEHQAVVRSAVPVFEQLRSEKHAEPASYLGLIVADAYLGLKRGDEAMAWYQRALDAGGGLRGPIAARASEAARELGRSAEMHEFLTVACDAGVPPACQRLRSSRSGSSRRR